VTPDFPCGYHEARRSICVTMHSSSYCYSPCDSVSTYSCWDCDSASTNCDCCSDSPPAYSGSQSTHRPATVPPATPRPPTAKPAVEEERVLEASSVVPPIRRPPSGWRAPRVEGQGRVLEASSVAPLTHRSPRGRPSPRRKGDREVAAVCCFLSCAMVEAVLGGST
jgi:hypothetical protein